VKDANELLNEICENAREDRKRIVTLMSNLILMAELANDPEILKTLAISISAIQECLGKSNSQLLEAAKIQVKTVVTKDGDGLSDTDRDAIFSEIGEDLEVAN
jgi:hypothetical protein